MSGSKLRRTVLQDPKYNVLGGNMNIVTCIHKVSMLLRGQGQSRPFLFASIVFVCSHISLVTSGSWYDKANNLDK